MTWIRLRPLPSFALLLTALSIACTPPPDVPLFDTAYAGPHLVGVRTFWYADASRNRTLPTEVWYPASGGGSAEYQIGLPANTWRDAAPLAGPFPVVLFSHSWMGHRLQSHFLCAHLASQGFLVVAPDHPGSTMEDADPANLIPAMTLNPHDLAFLLDTLPGDPFLAPRADFARVAAIGHSLGAYTVLAAGAGNVKNGVSKDPRVRAVVALNAPSFNQPLAALPPSLMLTSSMDAVTPPGNQVANFTNAGLPKMRVIVAAGSHLAPASNWCTQYETAECNPPYLTDLAQYEALDRYVVDFLRYALDGDADARGRLLAGPGSFGYFLSAESQGL